MKIKLTLLALALSMPAFANSPATVDEALAQAKKTHQPVLIDFGAPWCYSCYFMMTHVLNGAEWEAVEARTVVTEVDADSPDGAAWMKKLEVKALPAYVVLNDNGDELGRILGEQARPKFYPAIEKILAGSHTLDQLKASAVAGNADAMATVLGSYEARKEGQAGLDWYASLPTAARNGAAKNSTISLWLARLDLARAIKAKENAAAVAAAKRVLAGDIGCDRPYVVDNLLEASEKMPEGERKPMLAAQKPALEHLLDHDVFVAKPPCADQRSSVIVTADVDAALGDAKGETAVLDRAIEHTRKRLGDDLAKDRNAADNLRVYLVRAKRMDELDALYPKLIAAYPDDYVYPYRFGKSLLERDKPAEALPLFEKAAEKAYGENRLEVAMQRVKALKALHRQADAEKVVADTLEQNGQGFPEQVDKLKAALKS
ncbi:MAG TPA: thioredoxin family protein [Rhodanobacteraceae bacterium]|jgi:thioredoxin-like negative regulator of GroEL|nr:thioredoxin family protein [Rhodanobacteraceae bacterium]